MQLDRLDRLAGPNGIPRLSDEPMTRWCAGGCFFVRASWEPSNPILESSIVCSCRGEPVSSYAAVKSISSIPKVGVTGRWIRRFRQAGPEITNEVDCAISLSAPATLFSLSEASAFLYASRITRLTSNDAEMST